MPTLQANKLLISVLILFCAQQVEADINAQLEQAWQYIENKECDNARTLFQLPVATPEAQCIYGKSICCSNLKNITSADIEQALDYLDTSSEKLGQDDVGMSRWIEDAKSQCREIKVSMADNSRLTHDAMITERQNKAEVWSSYSGKVMSGCQQDNLSPLLLMDKSGSDRAKWHYVSPKFGKDKPLLKPTDTYLKSVLKDYVIKNPKYEICAPFIAVSSTQEPGSICKAAHRFMEYFVLTYAAKRPPAWISLYHYPSIGKHLNKHAERTTGKMRCKGVLGFFDWRRQSIVFRAPDNFFGTFRHELSHALMFWDMPLAPRWLEEGVAAMYEHTTEAYQSLENPWRTKVLEKNNVNDITLEVFSDNVLHKSILEFESSPLGATLSREVMRKLQQCGDLPGLYGVIKKQNERSDALNEYRRKPHRRPDKEMVKQWHEQIKLYSVSPTSGKSCL